MATSETTGIYINTNYVRCPHCSAKWRWRSVQIDGNDLNRAGNHLVSCHGCRKTFGVISMPAFGEFASPALDDEKECKEEHADAS